MTFSNSIDPGIAQSMEVIYGNVPAEFGEKIGAVINMTTKSGLGSPFKGTVIGSSRTFDTYQGGFSMGGGTQEFGWFASLNAAGSDQFTDAGQLRQLHNTATRSAASSGSTAASPVIRQRLPSLALLGRTDRDVTNTFTQEDGWPVAAGRDLRSELQPGLAERPVRVRTVLDVTAYARLARFTLYPSAGDTPITADSNRSLNNFGIFAVLHVVDRH